jgi:protein-tyrosine phosphatase
MKRILVVCTANVCRSPLVGGLLRDRLARGGFGDAVQVDTAGLFASPGERVDPVVVDLLAARQIDVSGHVATGLSDGALDQADLVLVMEEAQRQAVFYRAPQHLSKVWLLSELNRGYSDLADPYGGGPRIYAATLAQVDAILEGGWPHLCRRLGLSG